jgi:predicted transcriptional regulator
MVYNGLTKSDLIVFNVLNDSDLSEPIPISRIAMLSSYHYNTVYQALLRLLEYEIITRHRSRRGRPYQYKISGNGYAILDT